MNTSIRPRWLVAALLAACPAFVHAQVPPRLAAMTVRAHAGGTGAEPGALSLSFTIEGTAPKPVLIRAVGPALALFGVAGALADPMLTVYDRTGAVVATNNDWGGAPALSAAFPLVGAFPFPSGTSRDAALLMGFQPGTYTAVVSGVGGLTGEASLEVYETDATPRLVYLAVRSQVRSPGSAVAATVTIGGAGTAGSSSLLVRAIGPALAGAALAGALANPALSILQGTALLATNDNWGGGPTLSDAAVAAGLTPLPVAGNDSALLRAFSAGNYTAQVTGAGGTTGMFLLEVAQVDASRSASFPPALLVPLSPVSARAGESVTLAAIAIGKPAPAFQWRKNGLNLTGATSSTLTLASVQPADAGEYSVAMTNAAGTTISARTVLSVSSQPGTMAYTIAALAGQTSAGNTDGAGSVARFDRPAGIAVDGAGTLYVADTYNHAIRKIAPSGVVTTLAGTGRSGNRDGVGAEAEFSAPYRIALDAAGTIYVGEDNSRVRRITPGGAVTSVGGPEGFYAAVGGETNIAAGAVAADAAGHLYLISWDEPVLLRLAPTGEVTALAGRASEEGSTDGPGSTARFKYPTALARGRDGTLYVSDANGIRRVSLTGEVTTLAAVRSDFPTFAALAVDATGTVYATNARTHTIHRISAAGEVTLLAGSANTPGDADGAGSAARFRGPEGIAVDAAGVIFVADTGNNTVRRITAAGIVTTIAGLAYWGSTAASTASRGSANGAGPAARFALPSGVALDRTGNLYVADSFNFTVRRITPAGVVSTFAGSPGLSGATNATGSAARFRGPADLAVDTAGNVFVVDKSDHTIRRITPAGVVTTFAGTSARSGADDGAGANARFNNPEGIAVDAVNNLYVADTGNHTIRKITPAGQVTTLAGSGGSAGDNDGTGGAARFRGPRGVAVDANGTVYVADTNNQVIRRISAGGLVATLAGFPGMPGFADATGPSAKFAAPVGIAVDSAGYVFVTDASGLRVVSPAGTVTTVAGGGGRAEGTGGEVRFGQLGGLALDNSGNVYLADTGGNTILRGVASQSRLGVRMGNLSVRTLAGAGAQVLTVGFVIAEGAKPILIRGIGPGLAQFGLSGVLTDPALGLYAGENRIAFNNDWGTAANATEIAAVAAGLGGFALPPASKDAALYATIGNGAYTAQLSGADGGTGVALIELYDAEATTRSRMLNASARAQVGGSSGVLIAGFSVAGNTPRTVLIRGVGPSLQPFGVTDALDDPHLAVFRGSAEVADNDNWSDSEAAGRQIAAAAAQVGAFALRSGSKDAALLLSLPPGSYTAQLRGAEGATGVALVEVYEVP